MGGAAGGADFGAVVVVVGAADGAARRGGGARGDRRGGGGRGGDPPALLGVDEEGVDRLALGLDVVEGHGGRLPGQAQLGPLGGEPGGRGPELVGQRAVPGVEPTEPLDAAGGLHRVARAHHRREVVARPLVGGDGPILGQGPQRGHLVGQRREPGLDVVDALLHGRELAQGLEVPARQRVGLLAQLGDRGVGLGHRVGGRRGLRTGEARRCRDPQGEEEGEGREDDASHEKTARGRGRLRG